MIRGKNGLPRALGRGKSSSMESDMGVVGVDVVNKIKGKIVDHGNLSDTFEGLPGRVTPELTVLVLKIQPSFVPLI